MDDTLPPFFTLTQVAEKYDFGYRSLRAGCRKRQIEHVQFGRTIGMTGVQVQKLLADHTVRTVREDSLAAMRANRDRRLEREQRKALRSS
ncbi:hypothetical protein [Actinoplanes sp. NPDC051494]|uniref:hypothetical protein n=1 Tax=Actinoplanes sp. NPDC051494 TaxID=3363907 RepID=UPI00379AFFDA